MDLVPSTMNTPASNRPFFHPSAMDPILAHAMNNLAITDQTGVFLDPFSGTGTFLIEAGLEKFISIGLDRNKAMIFGSRRNFRKYLLSQNTHIIYADAKNLPFKSNSFDAIATDPPYGTTSSTEGENLVKLYQEFLNETKRVLK